MHFILVRGFKKGITKMAKRPVNEIKFTPAQLRRLQMVELDILLELDRVCRKNNISYFYVEARCWERYAMEASFHGMMM